MLALESRRTVVNRRSLCCRRGFRVRSLRPRWTIAARSPTAAFTARAATTSLSSLRKSLAHFASPIAEFHELIPAQLIVAIVVEPIKDAIRIRSAKPRSSTSRATRSRPTPFWSARSPGWAKLFTTRRALVGTVFRPRAAGATFTRTARSTSATGFFSQLHKLVATELTVFVFIEPIKQLIRIGWRRAIFTVATWSTSAPFSASALPAAPWAIASPLAHSLAGCLPLFIVQLTIAVGVELFDHSSSHFTVAARTRFFLFLCRRLPSQKW